MLNAFRHRKTKLELRSLAFRRNCFFSHCKYLNRYRYPAIDVTITPEKTFHFVGTIHLGAEAMAPLPRKLQSKIDHADLLIVEADISKQTAYFPQVTTDTERIAQYYASLSGTEQHFIEQKRLEFKLSHLSLQSLYPWHLALILQSKQAEQLGLKAEFGIDSQVLNYAKTQKKSIFELEGQSSQLSLLESLPNAGIELLQETILYWQSNSDLLRTMIAWWLGFSPTTQQIKFEVPAITETELLDKRNQSWAKVLRNLPNGNYVVAVGALHLFGQFNLPSIVQSLDD